MSDYVEWGDLPRGGTERAEQALIEIEALLQHPTCAGRAVAYTLDRSTELSRVEFERWMREADADGYTAITYAVDPLGAGAVVVDAWASMDTTREGVG